MHKVAVYAYSIQRGGNFVTHINISSAAIRYVKTQQCVGGWL
ncbi:hypothetical protein F385_3695 [Pantoea agglomerans 299R]|nr:hypothetical protein F385_3695 [Pantoea agglomerans 299R]